MGWNLTSLYYIWVDTTDLLNKYVVFVSNSWKLSNPFNKILFYQYTLQNCRNINLFSFQVAFSQALWLPLILKPQSHLISRYFLSHHHTFVTMMPSHCRPHPSLLFITWNPNCNRPLLSPLNSLPPSHHHRCLLILLLRLFIFLKLIIGIWQ